MYLHPPQASLHSCLPSIPLSILATCFWMVVECSVVHWRPLKANVYNISFIFSLIWWPKRWTVMSVGIHKLDQQSEIGHGSLFLMFGAWVVVLLFWMGGPIALICVHQERTSLSSCEAEVWARNKLAKILMVMGIRHLVESVHNSGHAISDPPKASLAYNDNESCVKWLHNMTSKQNWTIGDAQKLCESGFRILPWKFSMFPVAPKTLHRHFHQENALWLSFSTFAWFIHGVDVWLSPAISYWDSSLMPAWWAPAAASHAFGSFFVNIFHMWCLPFGLLLLSTPSTSFHPVWDTSVPDMPQNQLFPVYTSIVP